jgi:hypothetical protein
MLHQKEFHPIVQGKSFSSLRIHTQSPSDIMWLEHKVMHCVAHNIDPTVERKITTLAWPFVRR